MLCIYQVPQTWTKKAYDSLNGLSAWYADLLLRIKELEGWTSDFNLPSSVWLPGFFNPQSFLTAIMQSTARKNELPLDKMCLVCEVTKKGTREEIPAPPKDGAYTHGLFMEVSCIHNCNLVKYTLKIGSALGRKYRDHRGVSVERAVPGNARHAYQGSDPGKTIAGQTLPQPIIRLGGAHSPVASLNRICKYYFVIILMYLF